MKWPTGTIYFEAPKLSLWEGGNKTYFNDFPKFAKELQYSLSIDGAFVSATLELPDFSAQNTAKVYRKGHKT